MIGLIIWLFPKNGREIFMNTLASLCPALSQQVGELRRWPESFSSHSLGCRLVLVSFRFIFLEIYCPSWFLLSDLYLWLSLSLFYLSVVVFTSPPGYPGGVTSVAIFLNHGVVAFQPSATSEVSPHGISYSSELLWVSWLFRNRLCPQCRAAGGGGCNGASWLPTPHLEPGGCLAWYTAPFYT